MEKQKIVRTYPSYEDDRLQSTDIVKRKIGVIKNRKKTSFSKGKYVKDVNVNSVWREVKTKRDRKGPIISPLIDVRIRQRRDMTQDEQFIQHRVKAILKAKGIDYKPVFYK